PLRWVAAAARRRARAHQAAVAPALVEIAQLCEVRRHALLALYDALPTVQAPLRAELTLALDQARAGMDLADALRLMAHRCCQNFYLHQLAELVAITTREGGDLSGALLQLAARLRTAEELKAEQAAELLGYKTLTGLLLAASLLPLPYWALTRAPAWQVFVERPLAQLALVWTVLSGLAIVLLPYWLALED
ncbi:MAG TPA: type II secretion system F family protein, partial [Symbiobacteriaceae bacterium]|nr:type II secretion system F family protein [Symbiobacteriaceae bacterium]